MKIESKYFEVLNGEDMGISSKTMLCAFLDIENTNPFGNDTPSDPSDFGRCYRLLERLPEFKNSLPKLNKFKRWKPMVKYWDELTALYEIEIKNKNGMAPILYAFMQVLNDLGRK